jgi:aspartate-semialdehyde dehydrogenase
MRRMTLRDGRARLPVTVLGATGTVGQRFVALLAEHPWFELARVCASERSAGRSYGDVVRWSLAAPLPAAAARLPVEACEPDGRTRGALAGEGPWLVLSGLDSTVAGPIETAFAEAGALVVTNASPHRMADDVPLVVPEVNPGHLELVHARIAAGRGAIVANPNCSTIGLVLALAPLDAAFGVRRVSVTTQQALSGAGLPGVPGLAIADNVIPYIAGEEEKLEREPARILGALVGERIEPHPLVVSAQCTRVAVTDGHLAHGSVELERAADAAALIEAWRSFRAEPQERRLPRAPEHPTLWLDAPDAPQPRLHRDLERGMAVSIGRLRPCPILGWRFTQLSHNTLRGAAGGALLVAELLVDRLGKHG